MKINPLILIFCLLSTIAGHAEQIDLNSEHFYFDEPSTTTYLDCVNRHVENLLPSIGDLIPLSIAVGNGVNACKGAGSIVSHQHGAHYLKALNVLAFQAICKNWVDLRDRLGLPIIDMQEK